MQRGAVDRQDRRRLAARSVRNFNRHGAARICQQRSDGLEPAWAVCASQEHAAVATGLLQCIRFVSERISIGCASAQERVPFRYRGNSVRVCTSLGAVPLHVYKGAPCIARSEAVISIGLRRRIRRASWGADADPDDLGIVWLEHPELSDPMPPRRQSVPSPLPTSYCLFRGCAATLDLTCSACIYWIRYRSALCT